MLGVVHVSERRVYWQPGATDHAEATRRLRLAHSDEDLWEARYDFERREWWFLRERVPPSRRHLLLEFEHDKWGDADRLIDTVAEAKLVPEGRLLIPSVQAEYVRMAEPIRWKYEEIMAPSLRDLRAEERRVSERRSQSRQPRRGQRIAVKERQYKATRRAAATQMEEEKAFTWIGFFADPAHRIPIWRSTA
jgi:hypothetical protein